MRESPDVAYLDTVFEVLELVIVFAQKAQEAQNDVMLDSYLKMASRSLRCALEMHGEHLAQEMKINESAKFTDFYVLKQGEEQSAKVQGDADSDGGRLHGAGPASWVT